MNVIWYFKNVARIFANHRQHKSNYFLCTLNIVNLCLCLCGKYSFLGQKFVQFFPHCLTLNQLSEKKILFAQIVFGVLHIPTNLFLSLKTPIWSDGIFNRYRRAQKVKFLFLTWNFIRILLYAMIGEKQFVNPRGTNCFLISRLWVDRSSITANKTKRRKKINREEGRRKENYFWTGRRLCSGKQLMLASSSSSTRVPDGPRDRLASVEAGRCSVRCPSATWSTWSTRPPGLTSRPCETWWLQCTCCRSPSKCNPSGRPIFGRPEVWLLDWDSDKDELPACVRCSWRSSLLFRPSLSSSSRGSSSGWWRCHSSRRPRPSSDPKFRQLPLRPHDRPLKFQKDFIY